MQNTGEQGFRVEPVLSIYEGSEIRAWMDEIIERKK
jgi:hypothetical protein